LSFIEFSYPIDPANPVQDAKLNPPRVISRSRMAEGKKNNTSYIEMFAHYGTHIDMPWHFNPQGRKINDFSIDEFVFSKVLLLNIPRQAWQPVELVDLEPHHAAISGCDALLVNTGFGLTYRAAQPDTYMTAMPGFSLESAKLLASFPQLRCIGVDFTSVENLQINRPLGYPIHHTLLDRPEPIILLEDARLDALPSQPIHRIYLFPLRVVELEASPVTAVAEIL
jgi:arylformamidase